MRDYRGNIFLGCLILLVFAAAFIVKEVVLGRAADVSLKPAPALYGTISQLVTSNVSGNPPKDLADNFSIKKVHYFDNSEWAVVTISKNNNNALLVLQKLNGVYVVVTGPGTAFSVNEVNNLPPYVAQYIPTQGALIYTPED